MKMVRQRYQLIPSSDTDNQRILEPLVTPNQELVVSDVTFQWWLSPFKKKINDTDWFFPVMLLVKKSCNLPRQETQLATPKQKWQSPANWLD